MSQPPHAEQGHTLDDLFATAGFTPAQARASVIAQAQERWEQARTAYDRDPHDFYTCWCYLYEHPIFQEPNVHSLFERELYIHPAKVNPATREIDDDPTKNTHLEFWLEHGPIAWKEDAPPGWWSEEEMRYFPDTYIHLHDPDLDCAGDTFEQAIVALAHLVRQEYGEDRSQIYLSDADKHPEREEEGE